jgi:hypothetical protein
MGAMGRGSIALLCGAADQPRPISGCSYAYAFKSWGMEERPNKGRQLPAVMVNDLITAALLFAQFSIISR